MSFNYHIIHDNILSHLSRPVATESECPELTIIRDSEVVVIREEMEKENLLLVVGVRMPPNQLSNPSLLWSVELNASELLDSLQQMETVIDCKSDWAYYDSMLL